MTGNIQKYPDSDDERHERGSSVAYERQRNARKRNDIEVNPHVDERLYQYPRRYADRHVLREGVVDPSGYAVASVCDVAIARNEHHDPYESQFFGDYRKNEVPLHFRQVSEFLNRLSEAQSEETSTANGDKPLFGLEIDRLIGDGRLIVGQEIVDALGYVGKCIAFSFGSLAETVYGKGEKAENNERHEDVLGIPPAREKHDDRNRDDKENGSEVRLHGEQEHDGSEERHVREVSPFERMDFRPSALEKIREVQYRSEFDEFDRLKRKRKEWNVYPSSRAVIDDSHEQYDHEGNQTAEENVFGVFLKDRIRGLYDEREEEDSDKHVRNVSHEIEMVVGFGQFSRRRHERSDLERRIDTDRADHDHSENDEREDDEEDSVVDAFGFQAGHARSTGLRMGRANERTLP